MNQNFIQNLLYFISTDRRTPIINTLKHIYPQLDFTEDENRIYLYDDTICIAKNHEGNKLNAHEVFCSNILKEYFISFFSYSVPYFNMTYGIILKPNFIPFNKDENTFHLNLYQIYGTSMLQKGFSINPRQNKIGFFNGKLVLTNYQHFIPYHINLNTLMCNCGNFMVAGLEPYCSCKCDLQSNSNIKLIIFFYFNNFMKYMGGI